MTSLARRFEILLSEASERGLTPSAWWLGRSHHDEARALFEDTEEAEVDGPRLVSYRGLPVKVLSESPERLCLWCKEGALDL